MNLSPRQFKSVGAKVKNFLKPNVTPMPKNQILTFPASHPIWQNAFQQRAHTRAGNILQVGTPTSRPKTPVPPIPKTPSGPQNPSEFRFPPVSGK
jgi:hypothetical protein